MGNYETSFSENQVIPSWTGFNIRMHGNLAVLKSSVNYLDCIDSPAADISAIYEVCQPTITTFYNSAVSFQDFSGIPQLRRHPQNLPLER